MEYFNLSLRYSNKFRILEVSRGVWKRRGFKHIQLAIFCSLNLATALRHNADHHHQQQQQQQQHRERERQQGQQKQAEEERQQNSAINSEEREGQ